MTDPNESRGEVVVTKRKSRVSVLDLAPGMAPATVAARTAASTRPTRALKTSPDVQRIKAERVKDRLRIKEVSGGEE